MLPVLRPFVVFMAKDTTNHESEKAFLSPSYHQRLGSSRDPAILHHAHRTLTTFRLD